jgi:HSP20 family protein
MWNLIPWKKKNTKQNGSGLVSQPKNPVAALRNEFDTLFDRFLTQWPTPFSRQGSRSWRLDLEEGDKEVVVKAEAPGFEPAELDVQVSGNLLTIKAEKKQESKGEKGNGLYEERRHRSFRQTFTLPPGTEADKIEARYHNGLLEIHVPKSEEAQGKRIPVKA